jgi:capsular polysaccharide export protein
LINQVNEVWTMTSLLGFEALIRGKSVTCLGLPFYCGWG